MRRLNYKHIIHKSTVPFIYLFILNTVSFFQIKYEALFITGKAPYIFYQKSLDTSFYATRGLNESLNNDFAKLKML